MTNQKTVHLNAFETTLSGSMNSTTTSATVTDAGALDDPCWLVIDKDDPAKREYVAVTAVAGSTLTVTRYQSGSAALSGITHDAGATVHLTATKQSFDDLHDRLETHDHSNTGTPNSGAIVSHDDLADVSADDHHARSHAHNGADSSGTVDHGNLTGLADDDHAQYLLVDGSRAMTGALDMGAAAITNVGDVDGVDVAALKTAFDRLSQKVRLTKSSTQSIANGTTAFITWQTETEDASGWYEGTNNFVTVPFTGFYMFALLLDVDSGSDIGDITLRVNSATPGSGGLEGFSAGTPVLESNQTDRHVFFAWLDASDQVRVEIADQGLVGGSMVLGVNTRFYGMFLG